MRTPDVRYVKTPAGIHIAYQVVGEGPIDLVFVPGYASNLQWQWELPSYERFLERLASFSRLIIVDRRGLSDRFSPTGSKGSRSTRPATASWPRSMAGEGRAVRPSDR
jgi:hypothetical protein